MLEYHYRELLNFLVGLVRDRDAARELAQESYARVLAVQVRRRASGLLSAPVTDGWGDVWSWCALGGPLLLAAGCLRREARRAGP